MLGTPCEQKEKDEIKSFLEDLLLLSPEERRALQVGIKIGKALFKTSTPQPKKTA